MDTLLSRLSRSLTMSGLDGVCCGVGVLGSLCPTHSCHFFPTILVTNISTPLLTSVTCSCFVLCAAL
eukprot:12336197-Prorocentrum_lima.AAC.1